MRNSNYQTFYKNALKNKEGYVTKEGDWAAVPLINSKKFAIIHNGEFVHTSKNYDFAKAYIQKEIKKDGKRSGS